MKKLYTIICALMAMAASASAQDDAFAFITASGEVVPSGSTITVSAYEEDVFTGDVMMSSGLYVKNVSSLGAAESQAGMKLDITQMANGKVKHCFPSSCNYYSTVGSINCEGKTPLLAGKEAKSIQSEWFPTAYGTCTVTYTVQRYSYNSSTKQYTFIADGPSVTVNYVYSEQSASIEHVAAEATHSEAYNISGQRVDGSYKGIVIRNGKKTLIK